MTSPVRSPSRLAAFGFLFAGMAVVGGYVGFSKVILGTVPVFVLSAVRFGIALIVMLPWTFPRGSWATFRSQWKTLLPLSLFGNFLFSICMLSGVARTSATAAGLIMSTLPAVVALFSVIGLRERCSVRIVLAVAVSILGVALLTLERAGGSSQASGLVGNLLMVGAVCCEALYVVLGKRLTTANLGALQISAWINVYGFALMLPLGIWQGLHFDFGSVTALLWMLILIYAIGASVVSTWLWLTGLKTVPANQAGVFTIALPITASAVGVLFLGEHLGIAHIIAFVCAALGLALVAGQGPLAPLSATGPEAPAAGAPPDNNSAGMRRGAP